MKSKYFWIIFIVLSIIYAVIFCKLLLIENITGIVSTELSWSLLISITFYFFNYLTFIIVFFFCPLYVFFGKKIVLRIILALIFIFGLIIIAGLYNENKSFAYVVRDTKIKDYFYNSLDEYENKCNDLIEWSKKTDYKGECYLVNYRKEKYREKCDNSVIFNINKCMCGKYYHITDYTTAYDFEDYRTGMNEYSKDVEEFCTKSFIDNYGEKKYNNIYYGIVVHNILSQFNILIPFISPFIGSM